MTDKLAEKARALHEEWCGHYTVNTLHDAHRVEDCSFYPAILAALREAAEEATQIGYSRGYTDGYRDGSADD